MSDITDKTMDVNIWDDAKGKAVSVITDGALERLAVNSVGSVTVTNDESLTKYQLRTDYDPVGDSVTTAADVTLYSFTGAGVIDFIGVNEDNSSNFEVAIFIDGTERIRISMENLGAALGMANTGIPLYTQTANKQFRYVPTQVGFLTSFQVKAKATVSGTRTLKHICLFREKVS